MDISPNTVWAIGAKHVYVIPPKKHPDKLTSDWLWLKGEFSFYADRAFETALRQREKFRSESFR